jgi:hypothetical protein
MSGVYYARFDRKGSYQNAYLASIIPPPNAKIEEIRAPVIDIMDKRESYDWKIKSFPSSKNSHFMFFHKGHKGQRLPCIPGAHDTDYIEIISRRFLNPAVQQTVNLKTALIGKTRIEERITDVIEELFGRDSYDVSKIMKIAQKHKNSMEVREKMKSFKKSMADVPYLGYLECGCNITRPEDLEKYLGESPEIIEVKGWY